MEHGLAVEHQPGEPRGGLLGAWHRAPLYLRIAGALVAGVVTGVVFGPGAGWLETPSKLILRALGAIAPPLILIAVVRALMQTELGGRRTGRMIGLLALNTFVAIGIGLTVANLIRPGRAAPLKVEARKAGDTAVDPSAQEVLDVLAAHGIHPPGERIEKAELARRLRSARATRGLPPEEAAAHAGLDVAGLAAVEAGEREPTEGQIAALARAYGVPIRELVTPPKDIAGQFLDNVPRSLLGPLGDNGSVLSVIFIAVAFGVALRRFRNAPVNTLSDLVNAAFESILVVLHWIIDVIPFGVFGIVASLVGTKGFDPFRALGMFIVAVLVALFLQACYYLTRVRFASWVRPGRLLAGTRDALVMAFSTASSTATMPVTYSCLRDRVGLRDDSASMGALVGANFNNDGTALYEAMSALFIAQMIGMEMDLTQQLLIVITSVIASVGAAGIPEAGLVTMTLVFTAVGLPTGYIALLLTVDWFLDRCRTAINVMGDTNVACILDGKSPPKPAILDVAQT